MSVRVYVGTDAAGLRALEAGGALPGEPVVPEGEDEQEEFDALATAADDGPVVVVADVPEEDAPVRLEHVEALHVDADGSGDLAWYATQELSAVITLLTPPTR